MYAHKDAVLTITYRAKRLSKRTKAHFIGNFLGGKSMKKTLNVVSLHMRKLKTQTMELIDMIRSFNTNCTNYTN